MCYQLTHGSLPWKGTNEQQLKLSIQNDQVNFDYNLVSGDFIKFVEQCLDKNPSNRISVAEMSGHPWMQKIGHSVTNTSFTLNRYFAGDICTKINLKHNNSMVNQTPMQST
jgi:serine/threonine protein kinase